MTKGVATIADVAAAAGVSVATVSRALRDLPNVAPSTRARVRRHAEALDYRPDPSAAALAAGRTRTVAMAVPVLDSWYFTQVMAGAEAVLSEAGYDLLLFAVDDDARRRRLLSGPLVKRADGLILVDVDVPDAEAAAVRRAGVPIVSVGGTVAGASSVTVDDQGVAATALGHLIELGHRDIALVAGHADGPHDFVVPRQRREGYLGTLAAHGIAARPELEVSGDFSVGGGREAMALLLELDRPPTAVFAMSDEMAFGALHALWDRGLSAPGDVSIVGVDDHDLAAVVGLTTVHQEVAEHGAVAATLALRQLAEPEAPPREHRAGIALVRRTTTGPPPRR